MNKNMKYIIPATLFTVATMYLVKDIYSAHSDISSNGIVINKLTELSDADKRKTYETQEKIKEFNTNPKAVEKLLRERYNIIRKDQYIIQENNDSDNVRQQTNDGNNDKNN